MKAQTCEDCVQAPKIEALKKRLDDHEEAHKELIKSKVSWGQWIAMAVIALGTIAVAIFKKGP